MKRLFKITTALIAALVFTLASAGTVFAADGSLELGLSVTWSELKCGSPVTFTLTPQNGSGAMGSTCIFNGQEKPRYQYYLNSVYLKIDGEYRPEIDPTKTRYVNSNTLRYTFAAPGEYWLRFRVMDFGTMPLRTSSKDVYITVTDPSVPTVESIADKVAAECAGMSTDYEKALYVTDFIKTNAVYDSVSGLYED